MSIFFSRFGDVLDAGPESKPDPDTDPEPFGSDDVTPEGCSHCGHIPDNDKTYAEGCSKVLRALRLWLGLRMPAAQAIAITDAVRKYAKL